MSASELQLLRLPCTTSKFNFSIFQFFNNKRFDKLRGKFYILYNILYYIEYNYYIVILVPICYRLIIEKLKN